MTNLSVLCLTIGLYCFSKSLIGKRYHKEEKALWLYGKRPAKSRSHNVVEEKSVLKKVSKCHKLLPKTDRA